MQDFRSLEIWRRSHEFTLSVYQITASFPKHELYGLSSQLRPSAASIPSTIAEGCGRGSDVDFARFLQIAIGSASEAECQLILARDLKYLDSTKQDQLEQQLQQIKKMAIRLLQRLRTPSTK